MTMSEKVATTIRAHTCDAQWTAEGLARAVLEAMREPTDAMVNAGWGEASAVYCWRMMIDAALAEPALGKNG